MLKVLRLTGRCANGFERDRGHVYHAVVDGNALCGAEPGRRSAGWSSSEGEAITCARCIRKLPPSYVQAFGNAAAQTHG